MNKAICVNITQGVNKVNGVNTSGANISHSTDIIHGVNTTGANISHSTDIIHGVNRTYGPTNILPVNSLIMA